MRAFGAQLLTAAIAAIVGGIVALFAFTGGWFWSSLSDRLWYQLASNVVERLQFEVSASPAVKNHVDWRCPADTQLVSATCTGANPDAQVAVGPRYQPDRSFSCDRYTT